ncbi:ribbon-helix-helix protein, CopG family [Beduinella massiliensis]|uniref:ribbon-helix-helix protein, CopG family n=1 Tax=Beduinella massiliensis TaxID=1852363 RepID=UPI0011AF4B81
MSVFVPRKYDKKAVTIRIRQDDLDRIDKLSNEARMSRNSFINQCIQFALKNMKEEGVG